jgi:hypothetical protein
LADFPWPPTNETIATVLLREPSQDEMLKPRHYNPDWDVIPCSTRFGREIMGRGPMSLFLDRKLPSEHDHRKDILWPPEQSHRKYIPRFNLPRARCTPSLETPTRPPSPVPRAPDATKSLPPVDLELRGLTQTTLNFRGPFSPSSDWESPYERQRRCNLAFVWRFTPHKRSRLNPNWRNPPPLELIWMNPQLPHTNPKLVTNHRRSVAPRQRRWV